MTTWFQRFRMTSVAAVAAVMFGTAGAAEPSTVLVEGAGTTVTVQDILGDATRIPPELRHEVLQRPATVAQMASNLYIYRRIAQKAQAEGFDKQPGVQAALRAAQDKILADAWLAALDDKNRPSAAAAAVKAEAIYKAQPKRFEMEEAVKVRHILVAGTNEEARNKAQALHQQLVQGADFAELAKQESADKGSGARGGDLGFFARGKMVEPFEQAAFGLKKGELSGVVETQFGFHILRLDDRRPAGLRPFAEVRDELIAEVQSSVTQDARAAAAGALREEGKVQVEAVDAFAKAQAKAASERVSAGAK